MGGCSHFPQPSHPCILSCPRCITCMARARLAFEGGLVRLLPSSATTLLCLCATVNSTSQSHEREETDISGLTYTNAPHTLKLGPSWLIRTQYASDEMTIHIPHKGDCFYQSNGWTKDRRELSSSIDFRLLRTKVTKTWGRCRTSRARRELKIYYVSQRTRCTLRYEIWNVKCGPSRWR